MQADLFISIHADSFREPRASGSTIFVLSDNGATSAAARWLAQKENAADLIGGVDLELARSGPWRGLPSTCRRPHRSATA